MPSSRTRVPGRPTVLGRSRLAALSTLVLAALSSAALSAVRRPATAAAATATATAATPAAPPGGPVARGSIVDGSPASIAQFPFQVALYDPQVGSPAASFFCGGVILDATHVATAAHCVAGSQPDRIAVQAGSTSLEPEAGSVRDAVRASTVDVHYSASSSDFDVALLTLAQPLWQGSAPAVNGSDRIAPVTLDRAEAVRYGNPNAWPPALATASGWGDVNPAPGRAPSYPSDLRAVRMPLVSDSLCEEQYAPIEQPITATMICAGGGRSHADTCYGDSGGPLLVDAGSAARPPADYVLAGLVDFGNGCAQAGFAGVYTRVADPEVMGFLLSGTGRAPAAAAVRGKHKKRRRRHRRGRR